MTIKQIITVTALFVVLVIGVSSISGIWETVDAGEIVAKQGLLDGNLTFWTTSGPKLQMFGKITHYKQSAQFWFSAKTATDDGEKDLSIKIRFNDGGHAQISGSMRFDMPLDDEHLTKLHKRYGSQPAIDQQLVRTVVEKAVYMAGPLMSSTESYAERRADLTRFIEDQMVGGIYRSQTTYEKIKDPITGTDKTASRVSLILDSKGEVARQESSPFTEFGIKVYNFSINEMRYDGDVEKQIQQQQQAVMQVQTAAAKAREAEQRALTAAKEGEANAAKAKWEQETIKAKEVTLAEQKKEIAKLSKESAEFKKQEDILLGDGEAARRRAVMSADGALDKKLAAWVEVQKAYADAMKSQKLVPDIQFGGSVGGSGAQSFMDLMMAKSARELALDLHNASASKAVAASK